MIFAGGKSKKKQQQTILNRRVNISSTRGLLAFINMASKTIENVNVKFPKEEDEENNRFEVSPRADEDVGSNITNQTASNSNSK